MKELTLKANSRGLKLERWMHHWMAKEVATVMVQEAFS